MTHKILIFSIVVGLAVVTWMTCEAGQKEPPARKEVPLITFGNMSPPFERYPYFQHVEDYAFEYEATAFSLVNAWWLAEISTLAFSNEKFAVPAFKKAGLTEVLYFDKKSTQCYIASNKDFAVVVFRGSEIWSKKEKFDFEKSIADVKADIDIRMADWPAGGKVHRGFKNAFNEVWAELHPQIKRLQSQGCKIWITGHSLGGALATLCGSLVDNAQGLYTFGSPRVGNENFKAKYRVKNYRIVNNADIVCRIPPKYKYVHVGVLKFIDEYGTIGDVMGTYLKPIPESRYEDMPADQDAASQPQAPDSRSFVPAPFRDHVPVLYAVHLWNGLIENEKEGKQ